MKLPITNKYFNQIKTGTKVLEYREAHITFINEKTKEELTVPVLKAKVVGRWDMPREYKKEKFLKEKFVIEFQLPDVGQ